jgi:hypothetical protein
VEIYERSANRNTQDIKWWEAKKNDDDETQEKKVESR